MDIKGGRESGKVNGSYAVDTDLAMRDFSVYVSAIEPNMLRAGSAWLTSLILAQ
jgi:hypothetical protein